jgi:hypothetical protein
MQVASARPPAGRGRSSAADFRRAGAEMASYGAGGGGACSTAAATPRPHERALGAPPSRRFAGSVPERRP